MLRVVLAELCVRVDESIIRWARYQPAGAATNCASGGRMVVRVDQLLRRGKLLQYAGSSIGIAASHSALDVCMTPVAVHMHGFPICDGNAQAHNSGLTRLVVCVVVAVRRAVVTPSRRRRQERRR
jgi:hypothetical protein